MPLSYKHIEQQLVDALPEIRPAAERYWRELGSPGQDPGAYIFIEDMFCKFLRILLVMDSTPGRDRLLERAFAFVDEMLTSNDDDVVTLAAIGIFEGREPSWWASAQPFLGARAKMRLDEFEPGWRLHASSRERPTEREKREIIDLYGVRSVIAAALAPDGIRAEDVPGETDQRVTGNG